MPATIRAIEAMRMADAESPKARIPTTNAPTAPIPVHTAYAVPIGMTRCAHKSNAPLADMATTAKRIHNGRAPWSVQPSFSPTGQPISQIPANTR